MAGSSHSRERRPILLLPGLMRITRTGRASGDAARGPIISLPGASRDAALSGSPLLRVWNWRRREDHINVLKPWRWPPDQPPGDADGLIVRAQVLRVLEAALTTDRSSVLAHRTDREPERAAPAAGPLRVRPGLAAQEVACWTKGDRSRPATAGQPYGDGAPERGLDSEAGYRAAQGS